MVPLIESASTTIDAAICSLYEYISAYYTGGTTSIPAERVCPPREDHGVGSSLVNVVVPLIEGVSTTIDASAPCMSMYLHTIPAALGYFYFCREGASAQQRRWCRL